VRGPEGEDLVLKGDIGVYDRGEKEKVEDMREGMTRR
jgi:hypothetical protein